MHVPNGLPFDRRYLPHIAIITLVGLSGCNQTSGLVMNTTGKSYYAGGQWSAARQAFERALTDAPENPHYAYNLGAAMRKQGDLIGAERMFRHALRIDPRHQPSHHGLAALLTEQGRQAEAEFHLREWAATQPQESEPHVEMAWMQRQQRDMAGAQQSLHQALRNDPRDPYAMAHLGQIYQDRGRPAEAHTYYRRSLGMNPFQPHVKSRLAAMPDPRLLAPGSQMAAYAQPASPMTPYPSMTVPAARPMPPPDEPARTPVQLGEPTPVSAIGPSPAPIASAGVPVVAPF